MEQNAQYFTNTFLKNLYKNAQSETDLLNCESNEMPTVREDKVRRLKGILKLQELKELFDKDITYGMESRFESMGIQILKYKLDAIDGLVFPVYHIQPEEPNGRTILYLHGHDDLGVMGALLERYDKLRYHKMLPLKLAKDGFDVIAPEVIGFGEAGFHDFPAKSEKVSGCVANSDYLTLVGFHLAGFRVYQSIKTLDFIESLGLAENITVFGVSGGGMVCQQLAGIEDRIQQVIVACHANTYEDSILAKEHCIDNYVPGILTVGDSYQLLALAAPKPLLTVNGIWDRGFPEAGSKKAFAYLEKVYERYDASGQYEGVLFEGKHEVDEDIIKGWLKKHVL